VAKDKWQRINGKEVRRDKKEEEQVTRDKWQ
jgi:hypothetical protein